MERRLFCSCFYAGDDLSKCINGPRKGLAFGVGVEYREGKANYPVLGEKTDYPVLEAKKYYPVLCTMMSY